MQLRIEIKTSDRRLPLVWAANLNDSNRNDAAYSSVGSIITGWSKSIVDKIKLKWRKLPSSHTGARVVSSGVVFALTTAKSVMVLLPFKVIELRHFFSALSSTLQFNSSLRTWVTSNYSKTAPSFCSGIFRDTKRTFLTNGE